VKLLVDIGNSSVKWACLVQGKLGESSSTAHQGSMPADVFAAWLRLTKPLDVVVANVAGAAVMFELKSWAQEQWGMNVSAPLAVAVGWGVRNAYANAEKLGVDRWAALLAAKQNYIGHPCCVIDCGTALTIDVVGADGQHLGGLIVPGLSMMRAALVDNTTGIEPSKNKESDEGLLFACNTEDAVERGTLSAIVATINNSVKNIEATVNADVVCLLSGGDGEMLLPYLSGNFIFDEALVLKGLAIISGEAQ